MSDVHHRQHTFSTTYLNSPCGRLPVSTGVPRKFIPLPREPRNLQSRSRLYRGIFLNFNPDPAGNPVGLPRDIPAPAPVQNSSGVSSTQKVGDYFGTNLNMGEGKDSRCIRRILTVANLHDLRSNYSGSIFVTL